ncbi:uncharacterized protein [Anabrus simplex]|uniref:uncharacterized protein n=1 Tax=Anabrus simplex TaxID=316456 RepID=UPI0035A2919D
MSIKQNLHPDVWRTCNKVRAAIFRYGFCLWDYYLPLDPGRNSLISESQFVSVLVGPLKGAIGLSDEQIAQLADYFRVPDGRILYTQFCEVIHKSVPDFSKNPPIVTGLEWEDPFHVNSLSPSEERRVQIMLTKIATLVNMRRLVLRPYFQDYELISKNTGTVTLSHFARVLSYLGIVLSADDYHLLVKKFIKDSYTLNYVAFVGCIDQITRTLDKQMMLDIGGDVLSQFPGKAITAELPKLPRPEIGKVRTDVIFGTPTVFHPILSPPKRTMPGNEVIRRVQKYVLTNRVRTGEFFRGYDLLNCGRVTESQFRRCLDVLGVSGIQRLYLSPPEIDMLVNVYRDPNDPSRVCYLTFEDDIDQVFTTKELEKCPEYVVKGAPPEVTELPAQGATDWQEVSENMRNLCEETLDKVKQRVEKRRLMLKPRFSDYDRLRSGHVSRSQFRQVLLTMGILLSRHEMDSLESRYLDDLGFNYLWFLREAEPRQEEESCLSFQYNAMLEQKKIINAPKEPPEPTRKERDIVEILAKIKGKVVRERIRVLEFLRDFDRHNEECISREDFCRGLGVCRFDLTPVEVETVMDVFASPMRKEKVDYRRFSEAVEEAFTQACLERAPLIVPLQHLPSRDNDLNFLNFEERAIVNTGMQKLNKKLDRSLNISLLLYVLQEYDPCNVGSVSRDQFCKVLTTQGLAQMLSGRELETIEKCFAVERGMRAEVDYRAFCQALLLLQINKRRKIF